MGNQAAIKTHGGKRPGAGRKAGSASKRTEAMNAAIVARIEQKDGKLDPVEAIMEMTEWAVAQWRALGNVITEDGAPDPETALARAELGKLAVDWASKAAPYIRPRLNAVEAKINVNMTIVERIERGRQRIAA